MVTATAKADAKVSKFESKDERTSRAFLRTANAIKDGKASREEITDTLKGDLLERALGLYEAYNEQGLDGFKVIYQTLMIDNPVLKKNFKAVCGYAGTLLSDVTPEKIDWLWKPRLALGKIASLDGDPGLGKSILTLELIARITTGRAMPDGTRCEKGGAVIITPEDGLADTIRPRLERAGADLTRVSSLSTITETTDEGIEYQRGFTLTMHDLNLLEKEIKRVKAKVVVIDPLMAIMGGKDTYKDNEVRAALAPLQQIVEKHHVACIMVRHLTKGRGDNPLMAGNGSIAFIGIARTGLMVVKDKINDCIVLAHFKSNISKTGESLTYSVVSDEEHGDDRPYISWGDTTEASVEDLINSPAAPAKNTGGTRQQIIELLNEKKPDGLSIAEIADVFPDVTMNNLKATLKRAYDKGEIDKSERGIYRAK